MLHAIETQNRRPSAPIIALDLAKARAALLAVPDCTRAYLARDMAERHGGKLITPHQNNQPCDVPPLASFRMGRIIGLGLTTQDAITDWMDRAAYGARQ